MSEEASEKADVGEALKTGLLVTSSLAFGLAIIYLLAFFNSLGSGILREISFVFVLISMMIVFNISFSLSLIDQLLK